MRIRIAHDIEYRFDEPARAVAMAIRLMPRESEAQHIHSWRIEPSVDGRLRSATDGFGNLVHHFQADGPFDGFSLKITGLIETADTAGSVRAADEAAPPPVYLRQTSLTDPDEAIEELARAAGLDSAGPLDRLHALMRAVHELASADEAEAVTPERQAHIMCSAARLLGIPARIVHGYVASEEPRARLHGWMEGHVDGLAGSASTPASACVRPRPMSGSLRASMRAMPCHCAWPPRAVTDKAWQRRFPAR